MENYLKYLRRLPKNLRLKLIQSVEAIYRNELEGLDIKPLHGMKGFYRCRVGDLRIVFEKRQAKAGAEWVSRGQGDVIVHLIGPRGDVYKNL